MIKTPIHRYVSGQPYRIAAGQSSQTSGVIDRLARRLAIMDLDEVKPGAMAFLRVVDRELKIRNYAVRTRKTYRGIAISILRWFGRPAHLLSREHVRQYLEYLYDGGSSGQSLALHLSAIRTLWDKFCYRDVTLGLETPRRRRQRPVVLSRNEICRLLAAAPSCRDTLLIGLMYGAGLRVGEVCSLRWKDIDYDRNQIFVAQGKGNADRHVQLPHQFRSVLARLGQQRNPKQSFVFPGESQNDRQRDRHLNPRTVQRRVKSACRLAGITKPATPHSLRHAFATHSFEDGCDIRLIQKVLGHARIDTTTIYVTVAREQTSFPSPIDRLQPSASLGESVASENSPRSHASGHASGLSAGPANSQPSQPSDAGQPQPSPSVGRMRLHLEPLIDPSQASDTSGKPNAFPKPAKEVTIEIIAGNRQEKFCGTVAQLQRPGFLKIDLPPQEDWAEGLGRLPDAVQDRMQQPEFYMALQLALAKRLEADDQASQ